MNSYIEPSPQTVRAIDHCRKEFANTRGVTRNAIDQLLVGNTRDPYPPFREFFKDVCATPEADPDAYLTDLLSIKKKFRKCEGKDVSEAFMDKLCEAHSLIEAGTRALADGKLDRDECLELLSKIHKTEKAIEALKHSVIERKNELSGIPEIRKQMRAVVNGR